MKTKHKLLLHQRSTAKFIGNTFLATNWNTCSQRNYKTQETEIYENHRRITQYPTWSIFNLNCVILKAKKLFLNMWYHTRSDQRIIVIFKFCELHMFDLRIFFLLCWYTLNVFTRRILYFSHKRILTVAANITKSAAKIENKKTTAHINRCTTV